MLVHDIIISPLPRYDQSTYWGRARHFFITTNPLNLMSSPGQLAEAKDKVDRYRRGELTDVTEDEIWAAKHLVDSAYHPDTGKSKAFQGSQNYFYCI